MILAGNKSKSNAIDIEIRVITLSSQYKSN